MCVWFGKWTRFLRRRTQLKTGFEGEWSAFDPLPKLTQASDKDVRIIIGKERESYEPELNYTAYTGEWSHPSLTSSKPKGIRLANPFWFIQTVYYFPAQ